VNSGGKEHRFGVNSEQSATTYKDDLASASVTGAVSHHRLWDWQAGKALGDNLFSSLILQMKRGEGERERERESARARASPVSEGPLVLEPHCFA
jgi:hypothetical protein